MPFRQDRPESSQPDPSQTGRAADLRSRAEQQAQNKSVGFTPAPDAARLALDYQLQQHELQVHQIELSLQMEELRRNNTESQRIRDVYRDLYDLAPVGYFTLGEDGRILEVNRAGCQLLGTERGQLLRQRFSAYLDEDSSVPFVLLLRRAFASAAQTDATRPDSAQSDSAQSNSARPGQIQLSQTELTLALPGGRRAFIQLDALAEPGSDPPFLRAAVTDISALKAAQQTVTDLNATLEQRVQERTARIRELSDELETFVQTVTHNLQTPLRQFSSLAELLRRQGAVGEAGEEVSGEQRGQHYLNEMLGSVDRMNLMVSALADYFQSGRQASKTMSVNLNRVLDEVKKELQPQFQAQFQGREIVWRQDTLPTVTGDPQILKGMFTALLDNAVKFSVGHGQAEISIVARENPHEFLIGVRDNGVGFNPAQQGRLFGIFQRLHSERQYAGLGTGLARVRRAALRQGGRVWAEGQEGQGSCFWLALPKSGPPSS